MRICATGGISVSVGVDCSVKIYVCWDCGDWDAFASHEICHFPKISLPVWKIRLQPVDIFGIM